ncbi:MAG: twin-arginine translocase TatA/TatE family subunit [bacterium]
MMNFCAFLGPIGWPELLVILGLVLIIFGPRRLPEIAEAFGKSIKKFRTATSSATNEVKRELDAAKQDVVADTESDNTTKETDS